MGRKMKLLLPFLLCLTVYSEAALEKDCPQVLKGLYKALYKAITDNVVCSSTGDESSMIGDNFELLDLAIPLSYSKFNPGRRQKEFSRELPSSVIENGLHLVDRVYPTLVRGMPRKLGKLNSSRLLGASGHSTKNYHFESLSSTYDYILTHMMLQSKNFSDQEILRAKYYLQELVPNPELVIQNETELPRYLLYDYYRANYLNEKGIMEDAVEKSRRSMPQLEFEQWGQKKLSSFESNTSAAYQKWQTFGYKSEVERQLQYFDIDTHEEKLMSTRALFKSMGRPSIRNAHETVYPYSLEPANWYQQLSADDLPESVDQLQYKKSLLLAQQALLNSTKHELSSKTNADVNRTMHEIEDSLSVLRELVQNGTNVLLQKEVECFTKINLTACGDIIEGHKAFRSVLQEVAEHFAQAEYLKSILNGREDSLKSIDTKLSEVGSDLKTIDAQITRMNQIETAAAIDKSTSNENDIVSCPGSGQIRFTFDSKDVTDCSPADETDCYDIEIPNMNITSKKIWNVHSCTVDNELENFGSFEKFTNLMNSVRLKITASLLKVAVKRTWFDPSILGDTRHYTMKGNSGVVSPGLPDVKSSKTTFQQMVHSGYYLMPHYVSAFIVADNIKIFYPGLGSWNYSDYNNPDNDVINSLMKYSYAEVLTGGIGPFSFELPRGDSYNYQIKRSNGGLLITIPGGQVVGYVMSTVPRFPLKQGPYPYDTLPSCDDTLSSAGSRRRRSMPTDESTAEHTADIKAFARSLFSDGLTEPKSNKRMTSKDIEQLIKDSDYKKEKLSEFIDNIRNA